MNDVQVLIVGLIVAVGLIGLAEVLGRFAGW